MPRDTAPGTDPRSRKVVGGRDLPVAIAVGVVLAAVFLGSLWWDARALVAVVALAAILAYVEAGRVLAGVGRRLLVPVLIVATLTMLVGAYLAGPGGIIPGLLVLFGGGVGVQLVTRDRRRVVDTVGLTTLFGLWVGLLASHAALLIVRPDGPVVVLAVVGAAVFSDIGAYGFGVAFGRHKLAPSISPAKSWEGLVGGLVVAAVVAAAVLPLLGDTFTAPTAALFGVAIGLAAAVGDLVESLLKRDLGVKDLGDLLPGHGGVLDRVDGILLALPVGYYVLAAFS
jgi:phosphatidate cytidylyltransferase